MDILVVGYLVIAVLYFAAIMRRSDEFATQANLPLDTAAKTAIVIVAALLSVAWLVILPVSLYRAAVKKGS